jgi:hypothetical protein
MALSTVGDGLINIAGGNVGIGATNPMSKCTIGGDVSVTGTMYTSIVKISTENLNEEFNATDANNGKFLKWLNTTTNEAKAKWWGLSSAIRFSDGPQVSNVDYKFGSGVLLPDGRVIFLPYYCVDIGIYNIYTNTYTTLTTTIATGLGKFYSGVLVPDGRVIFAPYNYTRVGIYNPATNTYVDGPTSEGGFIGAVLLPNGKVLFVPRDTANIGLFNPENDTYSLGPTAGTGGSKFWGGVLIPDGRVIFVPFGYNKVGIYDYSTGEYRDGPTLPTHTSSYFQGGVLVPNGRVIFVPSNYGKVGIYNPSDDTYEDGPTTGAFWGGVLTSTGTVIFSSRSDDTNIGVYDPHTKEFNTGPVLPKYCPNGLLLPDGRILFTPFRANSTRLQILSGFPPTTFARCLHPCFNKN